MGTESKKKGACKADQPRAQIDSHTHIDGGKQEGFEAVKWLYTKLNEQHLAEFISVMTGGCGVLLD